MGLIPALGFGGLWAWSDREVRKVERAPAATAVAPVIAAGEPLFSFRRSPSDISAELTEANLRTQLLGLAGQVGQEPRGASCLAVSVAGEPVIEVNGDLAVIPASNLKVLTGAAALEILGPDYTFSTRALGNLIGDAIEGDLSLVGGGDPLLAAFGYEQTEKWKPLPATQLGDLAQQLVTAGVRRVTGNIVADESRYDTERWAAGWTDDNKGLGPDSSEPEVGPLSALMVNDGTEVVAGTFRSVDDPALSAADQFASILRFVGIDVAGTTSVGPAVAGLPTLASIQSAPLAQVVAEALMTSDNNTAELLLKEIGLAVSGRGSSADGAAAVLDRVRQWGISTDGLAIVDGSGMSSLNKLTCQTMVAVLEHLGTQGPFFDGLPIAGVSGTLGPIDKENSAEFTGTNVEGELRAKTGTLGAFGTKGLSGFVPREGGEPIVFSLIGNVDASGQSITEAIVLPWWHELAVAVGSFERGPTVESLAPRVR